jgi:hypothetical protein
VLRVRAPLTGYASLKQNILHDFKSILYEVVGGKLRRFYNTATLQQTNFITDLDTNIQNEYNYTERNSRSRPTRNIETQTTFEFDITDILERYMDLSNNRFDPVSIQHLITNTTYNTILNPLNTACPITHEEFTSTDEVIMINQCRHIFKKNAIMSWLSRRATCPCCRINIR